ncbi:MAG: hypothetical protein A3F70_06730 [Acidobacteria bacterium RIFCSPLOWO2_12_FULL_67_14]|nr:MAG: hypothetical protein A3F70_06730 [Acidobacteria bacterium RIFCSPLOWO2_12_FULL_67_14]
MRPRFFTTPADAIVNALALLISLQSLSSQDQGLLLGYHWLAYYAFAVIGLAFICIATKDSTHGGVRSISRVTYKLVEYGGKSQIMFSIVYLLASYSFFAGEETIGVYITALALWICVTFFDVLGKAVFEITKLIRWARSGLGDELGSAIGCENPLLYRVEVDHGRLKGRNPRYGDLVAIEMQANVGSIGMVVDRKQLLGKSWLSVYILTNEAGEIIKFDLRGKKLIDNPRSVFAAANKVFDIDISADLSEDDRALVVSNPLFAYKNSFVGYVTRDSNINTVNFIVLRDHDATAREITEGVILKTTIYGENTLYQVINGNTREEHLEGFDSHGYTVGIARKLGKYVQTEHELETRKWMPSIYSPLFFGYEGVVTDARISAIAQSAIGRLPQTDLEIRIKDLDAIVTHNTAILGILGIGKSCLSFELIKKVVATGVKVICVDITNQYNTPEGLQAYVGAQSISFDMPDAVKATLKASKDSAQSLTEGNPQDSGNSAEYKKAVSDDLKQFMESAHSIKIYNPDLHPVSKGVAFKNTSLDDLTVAEKTRIVAERLFVYAQRAGESTTAKYWLVLEEAHSLVPEWNSVSSDGDKNATNGTAKVILQGRKYGLGSLTITQRTANVSKSILNQCNTIFAMRVFDDTGKSFLENYIGTDYANTLPTLEERHAIAIGKGLRLKQPVIVQLNDRKEFVPVAPAAIAAAPVPGANPVP